MPRCIWQLTERTDRGQKMVCIVCLSPHGASRASDPLSIRRQCPAPMPLERPRIVLSFKQRVVRRLLLLRPGTKLKKLINFLGLDVATGKVGCCSCLSRQQKMDYGWSKRATQDPASLLCLVSVALATPVYMLVVLWQFIHAVIGG